MSSKRRWDDDETLLYARVRVRIKSVNVEQLVQFNEIPKRYIAYATAKPCGWQLGGIYEVTLKYKQQLSTGLGGVLECVHVDHELGKAIMKNRSGLHIFGIHMLQDGYTFLRNTKGR